MEITQHIKDLCHRTIGEVVAEDYRRAGVFERFGIDFCCGGHVTVADAAAEQGVSCDEVMHALAEAEHAPVAAQQPAHLDVRSWQPDFLASYIANVHHQYVRESAPRLRELTQTVARVHGHAHPEAVEIAALVDELTRELVEHADKEERVIFPYVAALCAARRGDTTAPEHSEEAIAELEHEHDHAGALMRQIRALSRNYTLPEDACTTYRMTYERLQEFEADLHRHVHLENNVLFPAAREMAATLAAT